MGQRAVADRALVRTDNANAKALCEHFGFVSEGVNRNAFFVDGTFYDVYTMALRARPLNLTAARTIGRWNFKSMVMRLNCSLWCPSYFSVLERQHL